MTGAAVVEKHMMRVNFLFFDCESVVTTKEYRRFFVIFYATGCAYLLRCADVILEKREEGGSSWKETRLGSFGMVHPEVLKAYELRDPSSAVEMDLEPLM